MSACLGPDTLAKVLAGTLSELEASAVSAHLAACESCRNLLDQATDDPDVENWAAATPTSSSEMLQEPGLNHLLQKLCAPQDGERIKRKVLPLSFLGPPRREGDLGTLGPYHIEAEVSRGGMGVVMRGYDETLQRTVAIKVIHPEHATDKARSRLFYEAQAAARFRHEHVVRIYAAASTAEGLPYLVMEYLDGPTLTQRIRQQHVLPPRAAVHVLLQVADGLSAAHAAGLVHRDIKPQNIQFDSQTGQAKILDFGLARILERPSGVTQEGTLAGTPTYMSPEQVQGLPDLDGRTDVYSLGVTFYEALTGESPFRGKAHLVMQQVLREEPRPPRQLNDAIPRDLETICLKAMAKEPGRRYQTAQELADDLRRWQQGEPIQARPASALERSWRWCRRNRRVAGLTAALMLVFLGGLTGILWQWSAAVELRRQAEKDRDEAQRQRVRAERNFAQAREAVDAYLTRVSEHPGLKANPFEPLRRELLQTARDFYERFVKQEPDDPELLAELGRAHIRLGQITAILDSRPRALEHHQKAQAIFARLYQQDPDNAVYRKELAECYLHEAVIYRATGQLDLAESTLLKSRTLWEELVRASPQEPDPLYHLARTLKELGTLELFNFNRYDKAERVLLEARSLYARFLLSHANEGSYQFGYGLALVYLGKAHGFLEQPKLQAAECQEAVAVLQPLSQAHPENPDYAFWLADAFNELGEACRSQGLPDRAEAAWKKALTVDEALVVRHPDYGYYRHGVADVTYNLATLLYHERHQPDEARRLFHRAADIEEKLHQADPTVGEYGFYLWNICRDLYNLFGESTRLQVALDRFTEAIRLRAAERPTSSRLDDALCRLYYSRAGVLTQLDRYAEAVSDIRKALASCPENARPEFEDALNFAEACLLAEKRSYEQAAMLAGKYRAGHANQAPSCYGTALIHARIAGAVGQDPSLTAAQRQALAERHGSRAVELLWQARTLKHFAAPHTRYLLLAERGLDPLRSREDFKRLLAEQTAVDRSHGPPAH